METNGRSWYVWLLIAFAVGLLLGLMVLGWGLWPVQWTNTTVQDLRPELRMDYVRMAAESFERTGNIEVAKQRLAGWTPEDLNTLLTETQGVLVARDPAAAGSLQNLIVALRANGALGAEEGGQGQAAQPAAAATAATGGAAAAEPSRLRQICTAGLFILLALAALAALIFLFRRWRATQMPEQSAMAPFESGSGSGLSAQSQADLAAEREKRRPLSGGFDRPLGSVTTGSSEPRSDFERAAERDRAPEDNGIEPRTQDTRPAVRPVGPLPPVTSRSEAAERSSARESTPPPSSSSTAGLQVLVENTAVYQMGESDYDEAFDINDPVDGYMGQCGLQLIEPFGRERDQAVALQVWLWDSSDPDTQTLVLMGEGAYRDTALRSQYAGEHQAMSVRPGTEFELNSHDLLLKGRVEKASYAEIEPVRGVFAELQVKLTVYRR